MVAGGVAGAGGASAGADGADGVGVVGAAGVVERFVAQPAKTITTTISNNLFTINKKLLISIFAGQIRAEV